MMPPLSEKLLSEGGVDDSMTRNNLQLLNAFTPIFVIDDGTVIEDKLLHPIKAPSPILVSLEGRIIEVKLLHPEKT